MFLAKFITAVAALLLLLHFWFSSFIFEVSVAAAAAAVAVSCLKVAFRVNFIVAAIAVVVDVVFVLI